MTMVAPVRTGEAVHVTTCARSTSCGAHSTLSSGAPPPPPLPSIRRSAARDVPCTNAVTTNVPAGTPIVAWHVAASSQLSSDVHEADVAALEARAAGAAGAAGAAAVTPLALTLPAIVRRGSESGGDCNAFAIAITIGGSPPSITPPPSGTKYQRACSGVDPSEVAAARSTVPPVGSTD